MQLFLEPADVWLFRNSLAFTAGEGTHALSIFPPTPETVQGAIRARIASFWAASQGMTMAKAFDDEGSRLVELIGRQADPGRFRVRGLTLGRWHHGKVQRLFPPPAHLLRSVEQDAQGRYHIYRLMPQRKANPKEKPELVASWPKDAAHLRLLQQDRKPAKDNEKLVDFDCWLTARGLRLAFSPKDDFLILQEAKPGEDVIPPECLFESEPRLGIGMNRARKTTQEGLLYQVSFTRPQPGVGLLVDVAFEYEQDARHIWEHELGLPASGWLALGGERRAAWFQALGPDDVDAPPEPMAGPRSCLYFTTPTYFDQGWRPGNWEMFGAPPVAAAVKRVQLIGGWQQRPGDADGAPKILRRCVPAGSVYFFDGEINVVRPITTGEGDKIGYGITYRGAWEYV